MSEHDFAVTATEQDNTCNRSINYSAHELIAQQTEEYLANGSTIKQLDSSIFSISNYKRTNASNSHLFRKNENATKH